jgi:hypothetical protein
MMDDEYAALKKKYNLPDFDVLDREFEVSAIDEYTFLLRSMRVKIVEKIDASVKLFNELLHPDAGFAAYKEANVFTEADRDQMLVIYRKLMFYSRRSIELNFEDSDELNARFINDIMKEWPELRKSILFFVRRMKDSWQRDITKKDVVGYFG